MLLICEAVGIEVFVCEVYCTGYGDKSIAGRSFSSDVSLRIVERTVLVVCFQVNQPALPLLTETHPGASRTNADA